MAYLTPGVYVEEISSGEKPIAGVGTGTGGFVGIAERGPIGEAVLITSATQYASVFGGYVSGWYMPYAVEQFFKEGGSKCYVVRTVNYNDASINDHTALSSAADVGTGLSITATSPGTWGDSISVSLEAPTDGSLTEGFKLIVWSGTTSLEEFDNLTFDNLVATDASQYVIVTGTAAPTVPTTATTLTGGNDGLTGITQDDFLGSSASGAKNGLYGFDPIDGVNMIAMPDIHFADPVGEGDTLYGISEGLIYCENRKDCFFIGDVPSGTTPAEAKLFKTTVGGFSSSYGALYYPWVYSTFGVSRVLMPPSGAVMGMISRTDASRGVFKAPAGVIDGKLKSINGLELQISHGEQEELNPVGVNVIRFFAGPGNVVWGARTCSSGVDAEWHYINVRRYFMYIEETLDEASQWVVFEPNTPALWGSVKRNFVAFLTNEWRAGALFGNVAEEAFYVKVDAENNPPSVRNLGQLIIEIGIAPVKPAEFVIIRISQKVQTS
ncbi:MAG: phage tail sheath C-terminal domain-containing protein [Leptospirales bacterium]